MNWKESKTRVVVWITVAILVEAVLVLYPLGVVLSCNGLLSMSIITSVLFGLFFGLLFGFFRGFLFDLGGGLVYGLGGGFFFVLFCGLFRGLLFGLAYGFVAGLVGGLIVGLFRGLAYGLLISLGTGLIVGLFRGLLFGFGTGLSIFAGVSLGILISYWFKEFGKGVIASVKQFFTPWRSERLYFGRSVGFFVMLYMVFVLFFALRFYASYLNANKVIGVWLSPPNPYFSMENVSGVPNYWTFTYFSFITIASLGYGDIYPTHWFSQILVILETMVGVGLIAGFLALIISVGGRGNKRIPERDLDDY